MNAKEALGSLSFIAAYVLCRDLNTRSLLTWKSLPSSTDYITDHIPHLDLLYLNSKSESETARPMFEAQVPIDHQRLWIRCFRPHRKVTQRIHISLASYINELFVCLRKPHGSYHGSYMSRSVASVLFTAGCIVGTQTKHYSINLLSLMMHPQHS